MTEAPAPTRYALDMTGISKRFGQTLVLDDVTFRVPIGTVHGLVGHNGAGKSTLMKIALGGVEPTQGTVKVGDTQLTFSRPAEARDAGVGMVLQELSLIPTLTVADNIFLNAEKRGPGGFIRTRRQREEAGQLLRGLGITSIDPRTMVGRLGIAEQQMVEIVKAVRLSKQLLILDEPTAPLSRQEVLRLFELVRRTVALGIGAVFITHHLREIFELCDEITTLREGRVVLSSPVGRTTLDKVVAAIVGSELAAAEAEVAEAPPVEGPALLRVEDLTVRGKLANVSFDVRAGEIVGVAGLVGSGRTVLLKTLFGEILPRGGTVTLEERPHQPRAPADAIRNGVYLIPEDRRVQGAVLTHTVTTNVILSILRRVSPRGFYRPRLARRITSETVEALAIRTTGPDQTVGELSGGNQQKVVLGKALLARPRVFLLDEPTFGVDVHTAAEIIRRVRAEVEQGKAALWVSSDLTELVKVADRIIVLADGGLKSVVRRGARDFTEDALLIAIQPATGAAAGAATGVAA